MTLTQRDARRFLLLKQGLLGEYRFCGERGVLDYIRQAGCVQFDPINICGRNAELVLQSRVKGFGKETLNRLLYEERVLFDYFDKNMAILLLEDWPCLSATRRRFREHSWSREEVGKAAPLVMEAVRKLGYVCSKDLKGMGEKVDWPWGPTPIARAALETLYFQGELMIHHKKGTIKYYCPAETCLPAELLRAPDPHTTQEEIWLWQVKRRIGAVGLLRRGPSDAFLGMDGFTAAKRNPVFDRLLKEGELQELSIEGTRGVWYCLTGDIPLLRKAGSGEEFQLRTEVLAPLDGFLWDRKIIAELFGFYYKWEIYTPVEQRKYGHYVLPLLRGEDFAGRVELVADGESGKLLVKHLWLEERITPDASLIGDAQDCFARLAVFNGCTGVRWICRKPRVRSTKPSSA